MKNKYYHQQVGIILDPGSDLYRRIEALAEASGRSFAQEVESAVGAGIWHHMRRNVEDVERLSVQVDGAK